MNRQGIVLIDIIASSFSLEKPRQKLVKLVAPDHALAFSHTGEYQPLKAYKPLTSLYNSASVE